MRTKMRETNRDMQPRLLLNRNNAIYKIQKAIVLLICIFSDNIFLITIYNDNKRKLGIKLIGNENESSYPFGNGKKGIYIGRIQKRSRTYKQLGRSLLGIMMHDA